MEKNQTHQQSNYKKQWTIRGGRQVIPTPFCIIGVLNITPDSFYDGGKYINIKDALMHTRQMIEDGADIIDIGAESTRPFASPISEKLEQERLLPIFSALKKEFPTTIYSVDTYKASTAKIALDYGAHIINDISGGTFDPNMIDILIEYKPGFVLGHAKERPESMQFNPTYKDVIEELLYFFEKQINLLTKAGFPEDRILIDPGIGFGKKKEHTEKILQHIERLTVFGRPLYLGISNKSLFKQFFNLELYERAETTCIATALLASRGIYYHRVHDVASCVRALQVTEVFTPLSL